MRPIDADAMREDWLENGENEYVYDTNAVLESIDVQPTIEAEPVVHGRWIIRREKDTFGYTIHYYCSQCGRESKDISNYCPNCGSKMDGRSEGE